jgi:hypothetical protein
MIGATIDYSVFPDLDTLPTDFSTIQAKADYIARICGAWDFGVIPTRKTFALLRSWKDAFDAFPVPASPAYAAFRSWFGWPAVPQWPPLEADYERLDERDGRAADPCRDLI